MERNEMEGVGDDYFIDFQPDSEDVLPRGRFELDDDDDRLVLVGGALDYADPQVLGDLSLIQDGVVKDIDRGLFDLEEGGFDAGNLMFGRSHKDPGVRVRDGFQVVGSRALKRWKRA